jgi:hypothetical protein
MTGLRSEPSQAPPYRRKGVFLAAFALYAAALFLATHWPKLTVPGPEGTDKFIHVAAFGGWTFFSALCGWFGTPLSYRSLMLNCALSAAYAGLDELLQGFEFVHRSCEWADYRANLWGVISVTILLLVFSKPLETAFPRLLTR